MRINSIQEAFYAAVIAIGLLQLIGAYTVNTHLSRYGISEFNILRSKFIAVGIASVSSSLIPLIMGLLTGLLGSVAIVGVGVSLFGYERTADILPTQFIDAIAGYGLAILIMSYIGESRMFDDLNARDTFLPWSVSASVLWMATFAMYLEVHSLMAQALQLQGL